MSTTLTEANEAAKMNVKDTPEALVAEMGRRARRAATEMARASLGAKNNALLAIADALVAQTPELQAKNLLDLDAGREAGLTDAMLDRLTLTDQRIAAMAQGLREVAALPDPVGEMFDFRVRPNGLRIGKMRVPIGVIGIIYESRPNVTADAAALCLKSGNACILRGGREAFHSNTAISTTIRSSLAEAGLPEDAVQLVATTDRAVVGALCASPEAVDCIIPRGGKGLIKAVMAAAHVPVIKHLDGVCHVYIHPSADLKKGAAISLNAKIQRTGVCNSLETLLIDSELPRDFVEGLLKDFLDAGVELHGCERTREIASSIEGGEAIIPATEEDWLEEYLAMTLAVKVVDGLDAAIEHINTFGSQHTDTIVAEDYSATWRFLQEVDSACVHINASTRFSDGAEYGLGCEIGISTDKLHARGPMGLTELTSVKWVVFGDGQIRT